MKDIMIKQILEKYFEGKTTSSEEALLRNYFSKEDTAPELDCYKPLFQYFAEERAQAARPTMTKKLMIWFSTGVAACLLLFFGLKNFRTLENTQNGNSMVYIEGEKYTDITSIRTELFIILDNMEEENEEIFSSQLDLLNNLFN